MGDSKQIMKILFLCLLSAWFTATSKRQGFSKFPTYVIHTFCVWLNIDKKWLLIRCVKLRKVTISFVMSVCLSVCTRGRNFRKFGTWIFFEHIRKIQVSCTSDKKNGSLTWRYTNIFYWFSLDFSYLHTYIHTHMHSTDPWESQGNMMCNMS